MCIVNADDYGLNEHCSRAIAQAFGQGLITDTTLMATGEFFGPAVKLAGEQGFKDRIGIHFNLTEGEPLTNDIKKLPDFVTDGKFNKRFSHIKPISDAAKKAIYKELTAQVEKIINSDIKITHADSHHHIHTAVFIAPIVVRVCKEHGIDKIRLHRNIGNISGIKMFVKNRYNNWLHKQGFKTTVFFGSLYDIENIEVPDKCEIMVHPDFSEDGVLIDRQCMEKGVPVGQMLPDLKMERKVDLKGYVAL